MNENNDIDYVPFHSDEMILSIIKNLSYESEYTQSKYQSDKIRIEKILSRLGGELEFADCKYADKLYPRSALSILALSRTNNWPYEINIDKYLEIMLVEWSRNNINDPQTYVSELLAAINDRECINGILTRLNYHILVQDEDDEIIIRGIGIKKPVKQQNFNVDLKRKIAAFLKSQNNFTNKMSEVYKALSDNHGLYDHEQALMSWMGYLIIKTIAQNTESFRYEHGDILITNKTKNIEYRG